MKRIRRSLLAGLSAAALLAGTAAPSRADPISGAILTFVGIEATATATAVTTFGLSLAASTGISYLARALSSKPQPPQALPGGTSGKLQTGGAVPRSFIVGRAATNGSLAYPNSYGADAAIAAAAALGLPTQATGNTPRCYVVQQIALSDLPVTGLVGLIVNGVPRTYNPETPAALEGIPIPEFNKDGRDHLWVRFYDGTQTAADPLLVQLFAGDPDYPYGADRIGDGVAHAIVIALLDQELFPGAGFPQCRFVLDGVKLYDRRDDSTAGGSGAQRWADPATWAFTANNAVIAENVLRGISYKGTWVYGAQTVSAAQLPAASWMAAANECDVAIDLNAGGTEPQFAAGGEISFATQPADTLDELNKGCNGKIAEIGGVYKMRVGAAPSAVFSFTDANALTRDPSTFEPFPSLGQTINGVTAKYVSPADGWNVKDAPPLYDAALEAADDGRRLVADVSYGFVTSGTQVQRLMKSERDSHRAFRSHHLPMPPEALALEPLDVVSWTSAENGYEAKSFDITAMTDMPELYAPLAFTEVDPNAYDWTPSTDERPVSVGTIVSRRTPAQPIVGFQAFPATIVGDDGTQRPSIEVRLPGDLQDVTALKVTVRLKSDASVAYIATLPYGALTAAGEAKRFPLNGVFLAATQYQVQGELAPGSPRDTVPTGWVDVTTDNIRLSIEDMSGAAWTLIDARVEGVQSDVDDARQVFHAIHERIAAMALDSAERKGNVQVVRNELREGDADNFAAIVSEQVVREDADESLAADLETLTAAHGATQAELDNELIVRAADDDALAASILTEHARIDDAEADLTAEQLTRAADDDALAASILTEHARIDDAEANLSLEAVTRADADDDLAALIADAEASFGDMTAGGTFRVVATADPDGVTSIIDFEVRASTGDAFASAGLGLAASVDAFGNSFSLIRQRAQQHLVGFSDDGLVAPWTMGVVNDASQITLSRQMLADEFLDQTRFFASGVMEEFIDVVMSSTIADTGTNWANGGNGVSIFDEYITTLPGDRITVKYAQVMTFSGAAPNGAPFVALLINGSLAEKITPITITHIPYEMTASNLVGGATRVEVRFGYDGITANGGTTVTLNNPRLRVKLDHKAKVTTLAGTIPTPAISYLTTFYDAGDSISAAGQSIGAADDYRTIVLAVGWYSVGGAVTPAASIGGISAVLQDWTFVGIGGLNMGAAIFRARVPTGTTANINISIPGASDISAAMWRVIAFRDPPVVIAKLLSSISHLASIGPFVAKAGEVFSVFAFGYAAQGGATNTNFTIDWSPHDASFTEDVDTTPSGSDFRYAGYHLTAPADSSPTITVQSNYVGDPSLPNYLMFIAGWQ